MDPAIDQFFEYRKSKWLDENIDDKTTEEELAEFKAQCETRFTLENWLPMAAKKAGAIKISTHPCTFTHPSSRSTRAGKVTSVIAKAKRRPDGYLRAGNVETERDAVGSAGSLDVYAFLNLVMEDARLLVDHIESNTQLAKGLLSIKSESYEYLSENLLKMVKSEDQQITSGKLKQVYFPTGANEYHLLTTLTNSGILFEAKRRINNIRFGENEDAKALISEARSARRDRLHCEHGWREIHELTAISFGGSNKQNISVKNNRQLGLALMLDCAPPTLSDVNVTFPKTDFFNECINPYYMRDGFERLHEFFMKHRESSSEKERQLALAHIKKEVEYIIDKVIQKVWSVKAVSESKYVESDSELPVEQKLWLGCDPGSDQTLDDEGIQYIESKIVSWIMDSYEKLLSVRAYRTANAEDGIVSEVVHKNIEAFI